MGAAGSLADDRGSRPLIRSGVVEEADRFLSALGAGLRAKTFAAERQYNAIRRLNRYSCALCKSAMLQYPSREINCKDHRRADCITEPLQVVESDRIGIAQKSRGAPIERSTDRIFSGPRTPPLNSGKLLWLNALPLLRS
jgi:hypothetical protein